MSLCKLVLTLCLLCTCALGLHAQVPLPINPGAPGMNNVTTDAQGRPIRRNTGNDSLARRDKNADSITIRYKFWDSLRLNGLDSGISDFYQRWPLKQTHSDLGLLGSAARSLVYQPNRIIGFDHGFHSYERYKFGLADTRFFETTRPYTEIGYMLGPRAEQFIHLLHTQNRNQRFNFTFEYRLLNSPGAFRNQNTGHSNVRFSSSYTSPNLRYSNSLVLIRNRNRASENGGLRNVKQLDSLSLNNPFELPTRLGGLQPFRVSPFSTNVVTGQVHQDDMLVLRQQYDVGQRDSLVVNDTTTVPLFYPRLRFQHTLKVQQQLFSFKDNRAFEADYRQFFNLLISNDSLLFEDRFRTVDNELAIITYPDKKNQLQYLQVHGGWQWVDAQIATGTQLRQGLYAGAEYRNRTRNRKWDLELGGKLFATGIYAGDFMAHGAISRLLSRKLGFARISAQTTLRTPSFVLEGPTSFPVIQQGSIGKENITELGIAVEGPESRFHFGGRYFVVTNAAYFNGYFTATQNTGLFNVLQLSGSKRFRLSKYINWYSTLHLQQATANAPVNLPLLLSINRVAFEGNFFKNLYLSTGLELRYHSPYDAADYSPLIGQFLYTDGQRLNNRPDVHAYFNFRIRTFRGFVRMENLNTFSGGGFSKRNFAHPRYAMNVTWLRFGIWWTFVN